MSSPIANTTTTSTADSGKASSGLYVPVHRRNASASSVPYAPSSSWQERSSHHLSPTARGSSRKSQSKPPAPQRTRSLSPFPRHHDAPITTAAAPRTATIPPTKTIPHVYALTELLALSSSPAIGLSASQRDHIAALLPAMTRKPRQSPAQSQSSSSSSAPSSPNHTPASLPAPAPAESPEQNQKKADQTRRRRSGRKAPNAKPRVPAPVEGRRLRAAHPYGASWGWATHASSDSWRAAPLVVAA